MKLGELFIELGITGDIKPLKQALSGMDAAQTKSKLLTKYLKDLKNATTDEEKALIKSNFAQKVSALRMAENAKAAMGLIGAFTKAAAVITTAVVAFDRIANAAYKANQRMISFQRQTGISFSTLNKYASASAAVNYNSTPEAVAQSLQNVASNLWDIRMGRGDISPYQELAFVGGKAISVWGKSVEQVIEELRESLKNVGDIEATNLITRMGFSADDLLMLRMTKEEFQEIKSMFMTKDEQEQLYKLGLELKKVHLELDLIYKRILLRVMPAFNSFMKGVAKTVRVLTEFVDRITSSKIGIALLVTMVGALAFSLRGVLVPAIAGVGKALWALVAANPAVLALVAALSALMLLLDDYIVWSQGGRSFFDWSGAALPEEYKDIPPQQIIKDQRQKRKEAHPILDKIMSVPEWPTVMGEAIGGWASDKIAEQMGLEPVHVGGGLMNNTISQNNSFNIHTSQTSNAVMSEMLPLQTQLKSAIDQSVRGGW